MIDADVNVEVFPGKKPRFNLYYKRREGVGLFNITLTMWLGPFNFQSEMGWWPSR